MYSLAQEFRVQGSGETRMTVGVLILLGFGVPYCNTFFFKGTIMK